MLCQHCKKNVATTHVRRTIDGKTTEYHLCAECAEQEGFSGMLGNMMFDLGNFWGSLFTEPSVRSLADTVRCPSCGGTFAEIARTGKVGCAACYTAFYDRLLPSIERIHGKVRHGGKLPEAIQEKVPDAKEELARLQERLSRCIEEQKYEECAGLRDQIRELEQAIHKEKGENTHE